MLSVKKLLNRKPWILSVIILLLLGAWLISGTLLPGSGSGSANNEASDATSDTPTDTSKTPPLAKVVVSPFETQTVTRTLSLYGRTAPDREAKLAAEVSGTVEQLLVQKGQRVKAGDPLVKLDKADRELQLQRANALLKVRNQEYSAAQSLRKRGLQGEVAFSQAEAALIEAKATVRSLQITLNNTVIYAPFEGIVEHLLVEKGDYLGIGDPVATIVDLDPLVISADVSERHIEKVYKGQLAYVELVSGLTTEGKLRYRATVANETTNTYPIEIEIANPGMALTAGASANLELKLKDESAIKIPPSMLALDEAGNLGIKTLTDGDLVKFIPIAIVKVEPDGVWLGGTAQHVEVITVGQGFVRDGDTVIPVRQTAALTAPDQQPDTQIEQGSK